MNQDGGWKSEVEVEFPALRIGSYQRRSRTSLWLRTSLWWTSQCEETETWNQDLVIGDMTADSLDS